MGVLWSKEFGLPVETGSGGLTKYNRSKHTLPKTHWLDAVCVGQSTPEQLAIKEVSPLLIGPSKEPPRCESSNSLARSRKAMITSPVRPFVHPSRLGSTAFSPTKSAESNGTKCNPNPSAIAATSLGGTGGTSCWMSYLSAMRPRMGQMLPSLPQEVPTGSLIRKIWDDSW